MSRLDEKVNEIRSTVVERSKWFKNLFISYFESFNKKISKISGEYKKKN